MTATDPRRILLVRTDRLGDVLMSLPVASAIRQGLPAARIWLLVRKELQPLLEGHPDFEQVLSLPETANEGWWASLHLARWLRSFRFDAALILNPTRFFHLTCFLAGIPLRIGYRRKWGILLNRAIPDTKHLRSLHETEYNLELAGLLGIQASRAAFTLPERAEARGQVLQLLRSEGVPEDAQPVAIHPWTSNPAKGWPLESFTEAARRLAGEGRTVLLIGDGVDPAPLLQMPAGAFNLCNKTSLRMLAELLRLCSLLVTNDSGPAHVAAAVGTPTVVVAPREHGRQMQRWKPQGDSHRVLLSPTPDELLAAVRSSCAS